ncbi:MAG: response regulator [Rhodothermaceae bacterium]|nr:response regulator [Rhodothermaceae bacterium]
MHRDTYRIFCVMASVLNPVFGLVYQITDPEAFDPLWARLVLSVAALLLLSLSYMVRWVEENFIALVRGYFYLLIVFIIGLTTWNDFSYQYTMGMLFAITGMGIAFSLGLRAHIAPLQRYLLFTVALTVVAGLFVSEPGANVWIVWACAASTALVIYVVAYAKIKAEELVVASEHRYHTLMNAASDAIFIAEPDTGRLLDANQKALEFTGQSLEAFRRMRLRDLFPEPDRDHYAALLDAHVFGEEPITEDLFIVGESGEPIPVDLSASRVDIDGRPVIQCIFRRHRYEQQLIQAKERAEELLRLKTSLLNNMSHELRTPLTSILGFSEILSEEATGSLKEHADVILSGARRLHETVNSVLGLAQLEGGQPSLELQTLDLVEHLKEAAGYLNPLAEQKGIALQTVYRVAPAYISVDAACLGRIVNNLVGNAIKFTEFGEVRIVVEATAAHVRLQVQDTGVGIAEDFLPRLFEEFQQESTGLARSYEGSGLGLAITKRLVELMDATIGVESTKGQGTTFVVVFPRVTPMPRASAGRPEPANTDRKRVLLVEDNPSTRALIRLRLAEFCEVEVAADPSSALALAEATTFDALLLDINLGDRMDGVDLLHALRQTPRYAQTPSVALTAYAMPGDEERFRAAGFDHYLAKPFTKEQLLRLFPRLFPTDRLVPSGPLEAVPHPG